MQDILFSSFSYSWILLFWIHWVKRQCKYSLIHNNKTKRSLSRTKYSTTVMKIISSGAHCLRMIHHCGSELADLRFLVNYVLKFRKKLSASSTVFCLSSPGSINDDIIHIINNPLFSQIFTRHLGIPAIYGSVYRTAGLKYYSPWHIRFCGSHGG